jgi:6-phosphofructokinase 1
MEELADKVNDMLKARGRALLVISEGFDVGDIGARKDSFGHTMFSASGTTVAQIVVNYLNEAGLSARGSARGNVSGTDQRHNMIYASTVDIEEAYKVGQKAALIAAEEGSGYMATILRKPGSIYNVYYDKVPLELVANSERSLPAEWIASDGTDVTDDFVRYARPLIGEGWPSIPLVDGRQRFAQLKPIMAEQKLPAYELQAARK